MQRGTDWSEGEALVRAFRKQTQTRQRAHQTIERRCVCAGRRGKFFRCLGPGGKVIGKIQRGGNMHYARNPVSGRHLDELYVRWKRCGVLVFGHSGFKVRTAYHPGAASVFIPAGLKGYDRLSS